LHMSLNLMTPKQHFADDLRKIINILTKKEKAA